MKVQHSHIQVHYSALSMCNRPVSTLWIQNPRSVLALTRISLRQSTLPVLIGNAEGELGNRETWTLFLVLVLV